MKFININKNIKEFLKFENFKKKKKLSVLDLMWWCIKNKLK